MIFNDQLSISYRILRIHTYIYTYLYDLHIIGFNNLGIAARGQIRAFLPRA